MSIQIINADVFDGLDRLADDCVDMVVTSPPYWGLRDYGVAGQIGLEPTLQEHLEVMVEVFAQVHRVLKPEGTVWLNYGDCYATTPQGHKQGQDGRIRLPKDSRTFTPKPMATLGSGLKPKDLAMVPNRLAIALQEWGWWIRSEIIWAKSNPMPESVKDRPSSAHEKIWLLSKSKDYYYDHEAIKEQATSVNANSFRGGAYVNGRPGARTTSGNRPNTTLRRNARNVWEMATHGFTDAHFATFPPKLVERCIKAGCPKGGTVLDPFAGAGTTGLVADRLARNAILIELNPHYAEMAKHRIEQDNPMFVELDLSASAVVA